MYSFPPRIQILVLKVDKPWKHLLRQHLNIDMGASFPHELDQLPMSVVGRLIQVLHIKWLLHSDQTRGSSIFNKKIT